MHQHNDLKNEENTNDNGLVKYNPVSATFVSTHSYYKNRKINS